MKGTICYLFFWSLMALLLSGDEEGLERFPDLFRKKKKTSPCPKKNIKFCLVMVRNRNFILVPSLSHPYHPFQGSSGLDIDLLEMPRALAVKGHPDHLWAANNVWNLMKSLGRLEYPPPRTKMAMV